MKIVIVGDGKVGQSLAEQLVRENHDVVVIDSNSEKIRSVVETLDVMTVHGNGASLEIQKAADVGNSDMLIAATSSDEINLLCCILARKLGCNNTIARVKNTDYTTQLQFLRAELGLSMTVSPEMAAAREIFRLLQYPAFLKRDVFAKGRVEIVELKIEEGSRLAKKKLSHLPLILDMKVLVCAIERDGNVTIPRGDTTIMPGDKITVTAPHSDLARFVKNIDLSASRIKNVMIIGGSHIALYLAEDLIKTGVGVKIIEKDETRCRQLAESLPKAMIINADGTRQELLLEEGIAEMDAVITLTDIDEENIIISVFADSLGLKKTVTKVNRTEYVPLFADKGIGSIINPKQLTTNTIIRYVRAISNKTGGAVKALHRIIDGKAEALEFDAVADAPYIGIPLSKLKVSQDVIVACISHLGKVIIPGGTDIISAGDTVIVVTPSDNMITDLASVFTVPEHQEDK